MITRDHPSAQREWHSYVFNFALLVALLIAIAFSSFAFPSDDMNDRITLTLTVFLGVIFFQARRISAGSPRDPPVILHGLP